MFFPNVYCLNEAAKPGSAKAAQLPEGLELLKFVENVYMNNCIKGCA